MRPILVTSGEPAGVGPDLCLSLINAKLNHPVVILADQELLAKRVKELNRSVEFCEYKKSNLDSLPDGKLAVLNLPCETKVIKGKIDPLNARYVINMLSMAVRCCLQGEFAALVTAPVHKGVINQGGFAFTGHTEFFAEYCLVENVVMLLACDVMKVALITTHLPLKEVPSKITQALIINVIQQLNISLKLSFDILNPVIYVAGLNPHAGEGGYLGKEEIETIIPALKFLKEQGINVHGPFPADTMFNCEKNSCDVFVAMYHDQGLPVLKYAGFKTAVNITLGLPFIRTSVDHGTALELAGTGLASPSSLIAAVNMAAAMMKLNEQN